MAKYQKYVYLYEYMEDHDHFIIETPEGGIQLSETEGARASLSKVPEDEVTDEKLKALESKLLNHSKSFGNYKFGVADNIKAAVTELDNIQFSDIRLNPPNQSCHQAVSTEFHNIPNKELIDAGFVADAFYKERDFWVNCYSEYNHTADKNDAMEKLQSFDGFSDIHIDTTPSYRKSLTDKLYDMNCKLVSEAYTDTVLTYGFPSDECCDLVLGRYKGSDEYLKKLIGEPKYMAVIDEDNHKVGIEFNNGSGKENVFNLLTESDCGVRRCKPFYSKATAVGWLYEHGYDENSPEFYDETVKKTEPVFINDINREKQVRELTSRAGEKFYSVGITVPDSISESGYANIAVNKIIEHSNGTCSLVFAPDAERSVKVVRNGATEKIQMKMTDLAAAHDEKQAENRKSYQAVANKGEAIKDSAESEKQLGE